MSAEGDEGLVQEKEILSSEPVSEYLNQVSEVRLVLSVEEAPASTATISGVEVSTLTILAEVEVAWLETLSETRYWY